MTTATTPCCNYPFDLIPNGPGPILWNAEKGAPCCHRCGEPFAPARERDLTRRDALEEAAQIADEWHEWYEKPGSGTGHALRIAHNIRERKEVTP